MHAGVITEGLVDNANRDDGHLRRDERSSALACTECALAIQNTSHCRNNDVHTSNASKIVSAEIREGEAGSVTLVPRSFPWQLSTSPSAKSRLLLDNIEVDKWFERHLGLAKSSMTSQVPYTGKRLFGSEDAEPLLWNFSQPGNVGLSLFTKTHTYRQIHTSD